VLEILLVIHLSKKIAAKAREKGHSGPGFVVLLLVLWFGGEIAGLIGAMAALGGGDENFWAAYFVALLGAALGGITAFVIVGALAPVYKHDDYDDYEDDYDDERGRGRSRGRGRDREDDRDEDRGRDRDRRGRDDY
jgi:hypothetical protein